jgi:hypothetical protein
LSPHRRRVVAAVGLLVVALAIGGAITLGLVTAPSGLPDTADVALAQELPPEDSPEAANESPRHTAYGVIVAMHDQRIGVKVKAQAKPVIVLIRPITAVRLNGKPAQLEDLKVGDEVAVVGRPDPRGLVARTLTARQRSG